MRHSVNIVVALLSMAAGAWTGTTAQTEQPGLLAEQGPRAESPSSVTLRGCLQKGQAAGTFLLVTPRALTEASAEAALPPAARPQDRASSDASTAVAATARAGLGTSSSRESLTSISRLSSGNALRCRGRPS